MIRAATVDDLPVVVRLVHELADYEREPDAVVATEEHFRTALFGPHPLAHCLVAEDAGDVIGFALWFVSFSTWLGTHGIYLEDLFVRPAARGAGHGRALLTELARIAVDRGYGRVEWSVLDWNEPAQGFYRTLGARPQDDWTVWRLAGDALQALGSP
ncbi:MAG TPA: GNAT family N-acetyltransferase [Mycobacteriales bacterium]|nr:GNAT family N-acetyltransferase [Mycobacteriales bacterium]